MRLWRCGWVVVLLCMLLTVTSARAQGDAPTHDVLSRALPPGTNQTPDSGYAYGSTRRGALQVHHGLDYINRRGTPIIAAGAGVVIFAGSDAETALGPRTNFYGNTVIIHHPFSAPEGGAVFTLYGHMSKVEVQVGQEVAQGQRIGLVGATGVALGSHLHLEVRIGDPFNYYAVRNPELWYPPLPGRARLIGRVLNADGSKAPGVRVTLTTASAVLATFSYEDPALPSDPAYNENFSLGDIRAGCYRLRVRGAVGYAYDEPICFARDETKLAEIQLP